MAKKAEVIKSEPEVQQVKPLTGMEEVTFLVNHGNKKVGDKQEMAASTAFALRFHKIVK